MIGAILFLQPLCIMGYVRWLLIMIPVTMTTKATMGLLPYAVKSTIVDLMDQRGFTDLRTAKFTNENVRRIYRKDMSLRQVAYYEISCGDNYYIFSAGRATGDHRLVENGNGTRPTELLNRRAMSHGENCATYYRITSASGLYICENAQKVLVASTYDFVSDSPADFPNLENKKYWIHLDRKLRANVSEFNKEWEDLYNETKDSPEWKTEEILTLDQINANITSYVENSLQPGSAIKVALPNRFSHLRIQVIGIGRNLSDSKVSLKRWQRSLCRVLLKVCRDGSTKINKELIEKTRNGISYIRLAVSKRRDRTIRILQNAEVEFVIEFRTREGRQHVLVRKRYAIDLSPSHKRSLRSEWSRWFYSSVPKEWHFPDYNQHMYCGCWTGCGPVAWAQVFGYYDRLAHFYPQYGFSKHLFRCIKGIQGSPNCTAPLWTTTTVKRYIEDIRKQVDTFCLFGGGATTHWDMADSKLKKWYVSRQSGGVIHHYTSWWSSLPGIYRRWIRNRAILAVRQGYPAVVGMWTGGAQHYAVATKYRYRYRRFRWSLWLPFLGWKYGPWIYQYDHWLFYHMGWGGAGNAWRKAKAFSAYAAKRLY